MARRKDHTRAELKEMVIEAACQIISKQGFDELSTRKIASEIGYTVGTLYNVFKNFDDLIMHINAKTLDELFLYLQNNITDGLNGSAKIKKLAKLYICFAEDNIKLWQALISHNLTEYPSWYLEKIDKLFSLVEEALKTECEDKRKIVRSARIIWASVHGICMLSLTGKLKKLKISETNTLTDDLIENYITGLKK